MQPEGVSVHIRDLFVYESCTGGYTLQVIARKRSHSYADEQNLQSMPSGRLAVERGL